MLGVVPIFVLQDQADVDTLLYLSLDIVNLLFTSRVGPGFSLRSIWTSLSQEARGGSSPNTSR